MYFVKNNSSDFLKVKILQKIKQTYFKNKLWQKQNGSSSTRSVELLFIFIFILIQWKMKMLKEFKNFIILIIFPFCLLGFTDFHSLHSPKTGFQSHNFTVHFLIQHPAQQHTVQSAEKVEELQYEPIRDLQGSEWHRSDHQQNPVGPEEEFFFMQQDKDPKSSRKSTTVNQDVAMVQSPDFKSAKIPQRWCEG